MNATSALKRLCLPLAFVLALAAGTDVGSAPAPKPKPKPPPPDNEAVPSLDPAKVAGDRGLTALDGLYKRQSMNNLKQIGIAVHDYHDAHGRLPDDIRDAAGKPILSWRVLLLPYLEEGPLYKEFRLDEPWDSKNNLGLVKRMPKLLRSPRVVVKAEGHTVYQAFTGPDAVFGRGMVVRSASITDGLSNTILAVEASTAVPWTKPGDIPFDRMKGLPDFGKAYGKRPLAALLDGSVRVVDTNRVMPETLKNAIDPADGNVLGNDWSD